MRVQNSVLLTFGEVEHEGGLVLPQVVDMKTVHNNTQQYTPVHHSTVRYSTVRILQECVQ